MWHVVSDQQRRSDRGLVEEGDGSLHQRPSLPPAEEIASLPPDGGPIWNRLIFEKSPYLLQHAANPVDWFPWGEQAFEKARAEGKPLFLSIGYATCHWCHVMERESFENAEIAAVLNDQFVCVKVDREERPEVDGIYMSAVLVLTGGQGGWPLSVFLTPDGKPFYGGTYFPPEDRYGRPGFRTLLIRLAAAWQQDRRQLEEVTDLVVEHLRKGVESRGGDALTAETLDAGAGSLARIFDESWGGFGEAPKFPMSHNLSFLLRHWARTGEARSLKMVETTLDRMALGGLHDHLGGGFHRYSTDRRWLVPHFEKMLYDQAILARTYLEAFQATGKSRYADVARGILDYVLRDMTGPEGAFYSAEDADSEGYEGRFYVWRPEEVVEALGRELGSLFNDAHNVTAHGNFELQTSILNLNAPPEETAASQSGGAPPPMDPLPDARRRLLEARSKRIRPLRDDKIITAWNGLMISAFATGSQVLDDPGCRQAAERAARFVLERLRTEDGRLLRRYRDGQASFPGCIEDYAFFTLALLDLYEATFKPEYLTQACDLAAKMNELFWDETDGGFAFQGTDGERLLIRQKEVYDGATPSGNSVAALALLRIGHLTADPSYEKRGRETIAAFSAAVSQAPTVHTQMLIALDFALGPTIEIVLAGESDAKETQEMVRAIHRRFLPNKVLALRPEGSAGEAIASLAPFLADLHAIDGKTTAYVCRNHACSRPTCDLEELLRFLDAE